MISFRLPLLLFLGLAIYTGATAQSFAIPDSLPKTKADFINSESEVIKMVDWYESTPMDMEQNQRKSAGLYLMSWISSSPTVTVNLNAKVVPMTKKYPELLVGFMGGWARYSLQNNYSKNVVQCNMAGIRCMVKMYMSNLDHGMKRNKDIENLEALDQNGGLEDYVVKQLTS
jgi:hypothetical protein